MKNTHLGIMIVVGFLALIFMRPLADTYDDLTSEQPWFDVALSEANGLVVYDRSIKRWMRGEWTATVQVRDGDVWRGVCSGNGDYTYRRAMSGRTRMTVGYFTGGCDVPDEPYRICADYVMTDRRGRIRDFGPFCTRD